MSHNETADGAIEAASAELIEISRDIHAHPELNYQEFHAAEVLTKSLEAHGFEVERGSGGVETAFRGVAQGTGDGPSIGILVEYDALPDVGHGCGHNLLAIGQSLIRSIGDTNPATLAVGIGALLFLVLARKRLKPLLMAVGLAPGRADILTKTAPILAVLATTLVAWQPPR